MALRTVALCVSPLALLGFNASAVAAPQAGVVKAGAATISSTGVTTTITQTSDRAVIDWRSFDIAAGETVRFAQPGAQSAALNRVTGTQLSSLQGSLTANGQIYLVNPNGILIGPGGTISASAFVASTASIGTSAFMSDAATANGRYAFNEVTAASATGTIVNAGTISVADGGLIALVAPAVRNTGTITARLGTIELASASRFTLDLFGDDLVRFALDDSVSTALTDAQGQSVSAQIDAGGHLTADGGRIVLLTVPAASGVVNQAINLSGVAQARSVSAGAPGVIQLLANNGAISVSGTADVSAPGAGVSAGTFTAIGHDVLLTGTARVDASGAGGGGQVVLGGELTTGGTTVTATTYVDANAIVTACGTSACAADGSGGTGGGGEVRLYSQSGTRLSGLIDVSGSAAQQAGTVEVISDAGLTELAGTAHINALSGAGQFAGFAAVLGDTLSVDANATLDMRDFAGGTPDGANRLIYVSDPASTVRSYVRDEVLDQRQTSRPILFHAYSNNGYELALPAVFDPLANPGGHLFASGIETPVGTLRPNGGAPTSFAARGADALTAIPVVFTPSTPSGSDVLNSQVSEASNTVSRLADRASRSATDAQPGGAPASETADAFTTTLLSGGPGVARSADLGRTGDAAGASPDVFGANYHVLAPAHGGSDAQVSDYLCRTPYSGNACR